MTTDTETYQLSSELILRDSTQSPLTIYNIALTPTKQECGQWMNSRIGFKPIIRRIWVDEWTVPVANVHWRFKWLWLYGFVHPQSGETKAWILPFVNTEEQIWADGINTQTRELLEAKFIDNPASRPYVSVSNIPPFIRTKIVNDVENEFRLMQQ